MGDDRGVFAWVSLFLFFFFSFFFFFFSPYTHVFYRVAFTIFVLCVCVCVFVCPPLTAFSRIKKKSKSLKNESEPTLLMSSWHKPKPWRHCRTKKINEKTNKFNESSQTRRNHCSRYIHSRMGKQKFSNCHRNWKSMVNSLSLLDLDSVFFCCLFFLLFPLLFPLFLSLLLTTSIPNKTHRISGLWPLTTAYWCTAAPSHTNMED